MWFGFQVCLFAFFKVADVYLSWLFSLDGRWSIIKSQG